MNKFNVTAVLDKQNLPLCDMFRASKGTLSETPFSFLFDLHIATRLVVLTLNIVSATYIIKDQTNNLYAPDGKSP